MILHASFAAQQSSAATIVVQSPGSLGVTNFIDICCNLTSYGSEQLSETVSVISPLQTTQSASLCQHSMPSPSVTQRLGQPE